MKSVNKILSLVLCLTMVLSVFAVVPFSAGAAEAEVAETGASSGTTGDCTWTLDDDGVLTISGNGAMGNYSGRYYDDNLPVPWGRSITKVIIEDGVTNIGDHAFGDCTGLMSVDIPDSVTRIGVFAFRGCTGLTNVDIPDSVTSIGTEAFIDCAGLTSVTIGKSVTSIHDNDGIESYHPFGRCPNLTNIKVSVDNPVYDSRNDCNGIIETETNTLICGCKNTKIPDSVTCIGGAFYDCSGLTSITIPNSVTSIWFLSFCDCRDLANIVIPDSVTTIEWLGIWDTTHICCSPGSAAETYAKNNGNSYGHDYVLTPIDAENHQGVCSYCGAKTEPEAHTFTDGVCASCGAKVESGTTGDCTWTLDDDGLLTISGNGAMGNDEPHPWGTNISKVIIEEGVTSIGDFAFFECAELTSIDIPDSVTSIGWTAFADCTGLTNVTIGNSVTRIYDEAFSGCTGLTSIDIPDSVTSIGFWAFKDCTGLTNITIPDSVTSIGDKAIPSTTHICCSPGSEAETYAKKWGNSYGHDYVLTPIDAENHQGVCSYCGAKTEPEAHTFTDGVCTCGCKEPLIELVDGYFYIDGLLAKGKGAVEYAGDIYFVRNNGSVFTSGKLYVTEAKANGILTAGTYYFDAEGKLINSGVAGGYYFENHKIAKGAGIIEFENNIYYIRNDGSAAVSTKIGIPEAKTNGLISSGYYSFDEAGRLISDGIVDGYYYKDCVIVKSAGIVQFEGDLYYIRNDGSIFTSGRLYVTEPKSNGLIEAGTYRFDGDGKLIK